MFLSIRHAAWNYTQCLFLSQNIVSPPSLHCMVLAGSDRSQPITSLTYFPAGSPVSSPRSIRFNHFSRSGLFNAQAGSCLTQSQGLSIVLFTKFSVFPPFFLAEEKVWVGLLLRTDNKCSGLEPKLATWSILQVLQRQVCHCHGEPGPDQLQTVKDSDCPSGQSDSSFL